MTIRTASGTSLGMPDAAPIGDLGPGLEEIHSWPRRTALIVGARPNRQVLSVLRRHGFGTAVATLDQISRVAPLTAPFTFVVLGPDVLTDDRAIDLVREAHGYSPSARMLLDCPTAQLETALLVRALRAGVADVLDANDPAAFLRAVTDGLDALGRHRERVLAVGAHPDDVELGCAGTLIDHRLRGDRVTILTLSRGAVGGDQQSRLAEATAAAGAIGAQLIFGDLEDTQIEDGHATISLIEKVVRALDPTVVYVHSKNDSHQDHRAVSTATASATRQVRRVFAYQSPSATNEYRPTQFVAVDHVLQRKVQVLMMFDSQNGRSYLEPELVVAGSRYWARHLAANARYAEPFEVIRSVGDLRQAATASRPVLSGQPAFGLPAYESTHLFRPRAVATG